jgi:pimeloyl-ACP methyl ester carboxylesterase
MIHAVNRIISAFIGIALVISMPVAAQTASATYGSNAAVGKYAAINGIKIYYEVYGQGKPMLLIHGNGGSIADMRNQIEFFSKNYQVIAADNRAQGKTSDAPGRITYEQMADDINGLLDYLKIDSAYTIGWSDGGIIGLLMAIHHPAKIKMLAVMGANLQPDSSAVYPWAVKWVAQNAAQAAQMLQNKDTSHNWVVDAKLLDLLGKQPHIPLTDIAKITAPTLVLGGDKDVIKEEHTMQIYHHISKSWLCIFPGGTHMMPVTDPALFNATVDSFFSKPYNRPDTKTFFGVQ